MAFDLDAVIAERDALQPFTFTFDGAEYTLPSDIDVQVLDLLTQGQIAPALELLLGDDQWQQIFSSPKLLGTAALGDLITAYMTHLGVGDVGESSASTRFSPGTARPSKQTSNGSTASVSTISDAPSPGDG